MGAKNSRSNKENEDKKPEAQPPRGHQYDEINEDDFIKKRENLEEEKKKQSSGLADSLVDGKESNHNIGPSNTSTKARVHPYDEIVLTDNEKQSSENGSSRQKDAIKLDSKAKDKTSKKVEKKKKTKKDDKSKKDEVVPQDVASSDHVIESDVEYANVEAMKRSEVREESEPSGDLYATSAKVKKQDKGVDSKKSESKKFEDSQPNKQLNYIEVEIAPKATKGTRPEPKSPQPQQSTTYSNIIRENGRIVLVPEQ